MKYVIEPMTQGDIPGVLEVDRESYALPWPASAYRRELNGNQQARYIVLRELQRVEQPTENGSGTDKEPHRSWHAPLSWLRSVDKPEVKPGRIIGYAGMWLVADEAHVTTVAVRAAHRRKGFGELLLASLIRIAYELGVRWVTLEVRVTNEPAQLLYEKYGFRKAGLRKRYYSDNNEDAIIMTTDDITLNAYQSRFDDLRLNLRDRIMSSPEVEPVASVLAGRTRR